MNEEAFLDQLAECEKLDTEVAHNNADAVLTDALRVVGWSRLADKFDDMRGSFWYS